MLRVTTKAAVGQVIWSLYISELYARIGSRRLLFIQSLERCDGLLQWDDVREGPLMHLRRIECRSQSVSRVNQLLI